MIRGIRPGRKHLALLVALIAMMVAEPLVGHRSLAGGAGADAVLALICLSLFFIIFEEGWERRAAMAIILPAFASNFGIYVLPDGLHVAAEVTYHCFMVAFLGFAVAVILRDIFKKRVISGDDVIGAFCGYMLLALVWADLYNLTYLFFPGVFAVNAEITWRMATGTGGAPCSTT